MKSGKVTSARPNGPGTAPTRPPKPFVLDDDPTGTQSVQGVPVLTRWDTQALENELRDPSPACFLLTNSRAVPESDAVRIARDTGNMLAQASANTGIPFTVVSRSDSTLRGHFPAEVDALADALGMQGAPVLLCPFFAAGGRVTEGGTHFLLDADGHRIPVGETEFARDTTFGYRASFLSEWVEERSRGAIRAAEVGLVDLATVRGPQALLVERLRDCLRTFRVVVPDALVRDDVARLVDAVRVLEDQGQRLIARTAADFAAERAGIAPRPVLKPETLGLDCGPLLVVVGSYVDKSSRQLARLIAEGNVRAVELDVDAVLGGAGGRGQAVQRCVQEVAQWLHDGLDTVVFTSRERRQAGLLGSGGVVADALAEVVVRTPIRPRAVVSKGGITSSRTAVDGLGMARAWVAGAACPGVPVWIGGPESRWPGLPLVVFPGNVGSDDALLDLVQRWRDTGR